MALEGMAQEGPPAESDEVKNRVFDLGVVEVVENYQDQKNKTVDRVYDEEMRDLGKNFLADALNILPGVTVTQLGARNETMVNVRGFDVKHVPIFLDGIPIYVPYDGYPDLDRFSTFDLSEIVLSKGFTSVLYGPNTMGGAINMVSKRPTTVFEMNAGVGYSSGDTTSSYGNFGTNQGKWYLQGGASYVDSDHFRLSDDFTPSRTEDGGDRDNSYRRDRKINAKIGWTPNETDEYAFSFINQHGEKGVPPYTGTDPTNTVRYWQWPYWDKESFYFNSNTALGDRSYVKTRLYYDMFQNSLFSYDDDTYSTMKKKSSFKSAYDDHTTGGSVELGTTLLPWNSLRLAVHYKRDIHKEHNNNDPFQRFEDELFSIGLEDTIDITERFYAILGMSYDHVETLQAQQLSTSGVLVDFPKNDSESYNPQAGLFYKVVEDGVAHVSVAAKSRLPSIKDRYSFRLGTALPNPDLQAEKSINYELGYQQVLFKRLTLEATAFYYDISDFILLTTIPNPANPRKTLNQNQNIGDVSQYGVEIGASGQILDCLKGGLSYTFLQYDNRSNEDKLTNLPEHKLYSYLQYFPIKPVSILGSVEYDSSRYSSSNGVRKADGFFVVDTKVMWEAFSGFVAEAGINNITDENYALDEGFPEPGRNYFVSLRYRF
jgi:iron complex outermembrane recepter protein